MSKENPRSPKTANEQISEKTSRRNFLVGSAAAVGALAATAIPRGAQADERLFCGLTIFDSKGLYVKCPPPPPEYKGALAEMIVKAWTSPDYQKQLLTFDEGKPTDWSWYDETYRTDRLKRTSAMFVAVKIPLGNVQPVVLSQKQFENGIFRKHDDNETVFQLPDVPKYLEISKIADKDVQRGIAMYAIDFHVCGM